MRTLIVMLMLLLMQDVTAQISFFNRYARDSYDKGEGAVQLDDSSYLITGSSTSFLEASQQAFIMKIDSTGKRLWTKSYGGAETDKGRRIFAVNNDGIYVLGQTSSYTSSFYDIYFFKTDFQGNLLFETHFGGDKYEDIRDAVMLSDTSFILVGQSLSNASEQADMLLMRISSKGDVLWEQHLGDAVKSDLAEAIVAYNDTIVYFCGNKFDSGSSLQRAFISRMHINGTIEWMMDYGSTDAQSFRDLDIYRDTIRAGGYFTKAGSVDHGFYRAFLDINGNVLRQDFEVHDGSYEINQIARFQANDYILSMQVKDDPVVPTKAGGWDNVLYNFNEILNYNYYAVNFSLPDEDLMNDMIRTSDGGIFAVGYSSLNNEVKLNVLKVDGRHSFDIVNVPETNQSFVGINNLDATYFSVYPNPSGDIVFVHATYPMRGLSVRDASGRVVLENTLNAKQITLSLGSFEPGIYALEIATSEGVYRSKLMITR